MIMIMNTARACAVNRVCVMPMVPVANGTSAVDTWRTMPTENIYYTVSIPASNAQSLLVSLSSTGEVALAVRFNAQAGCSNYYGSPSCNNDYVSIGASLTKSIYVTQCSLGAGSWSVAVYGQTASIYNLSFQLSELR